METVGETECRSADHWDWRKTSDTANGVMNIAAAQDGDKPWWVVCAHSGDLERTDVRFAAR